MFTEYVTAQYLASGIHAARTGPSTEGDDARERIDLYSHPLFTFVLDHD